MSRGFQASVLQFVRNVVQDRSDEETTVDLQVGKTVHSDVPRHMRTELWMSVLLRKGIGTAAAQQYKEMLSKPVPQDIQENIEKDVGRTFPDVPRFATREGRWALFCVLKAYAAYDEEVNYCQGMNFLAGLLLTYLSSQSAAFGIMVVLMQERGLRDLYKTDLSVLQARLWQVGQLMPARLRQHMDQQGALPVLYASSWLLTAFASEFPLFFAARVMDVILADCYIEPMMKVALGILWQVGGTLLQLKDMEGIVHVLKVGVVRLRKETLQALLTKALAREWTPAQAAILAQTEGVESVHQAVRRVSLPGSQLTAVELQGPAPECLGPAPELGVGSSVQLQGPALDRPRGLLKEPSWAARLSKSTPLQLSPGQQERQRSSAQPATSSTIHTDASNEHASRTAAPEPDLPLLSLSLAPEGQATHDRSAASHARQSAGAVPATPLQSTPSSHLLDTDVVPGQAPSHLGKCSPPSGVPHAPEDKDDRHRAVAGKPAEENPHGPGIRHTGHAENTTGVLVEGQPDLLQQAGSSASSQGSFGDFEAPSAHWTPSFAPASDEERLARGSATHPREPHGSTSTGTLLHTHSQSTSRESLADSQAAAEERLRQRWLDRRPGTIHLLDSHDGVLVSEPSSAVHEHSCPGSFHTSDAGSETPGRDNSVHAPENGSRQLPSH